MKKLKILIWICGVMACVVVSVGYGNPALTGCCLCYMGW